jgi:hypothetical protein
MFFLACIFHLTRTLQTRLVQETDNTGQGKISKEQTGSQQPMAMLIRLGFLCVSALALC